MLNHPGFAPNSRDLGKFWRVVAAMKPAAPTERPALRRRPGRRLGEGARGVLLLAAILVAACAYVLLLDRLGIPLAVATDLPLVD